MRGTLVTLVANLPHAPPRSYLATLPAEGGCREIGSTLAFMEPSLPFAALGLVGAGFTNVCSIHCGCYPCEPHDRTFVG